MPLDSSIRTAHSNASRVNHNCLAFAQASSIKEYCKPETWSHATQTAWSELMYAQSHCFCHSHVVWVQLRRPFTVFWVYALFSTRVLPLEFSVIGSLTTTCSIENNRWSVMVKKNRYFIHLHMSVERLVSAVNLRVLWMNWMWIVLCVLKTLFFMQT